MSRLFPATLAALAALGSGIAFAIEPGRPNWVEPVSSGGVALVRAATPGPQTAVPSTDEPIPPIRIDIMKVPVSAPVLTVETPAPAPTASLPVVPPDIQSSGVQPPVPSATREPVPTKPTPKDSTTARDAGSPKPSLSR